jgi:hypothetical protein
MSRLPLNIDIKRLQWEFHENGYFDWDLYDGLKKGKASENGLVVRQILLSHFLAEGEDGSEGGEAYKMLCLTDYNGEMDTTELKSFDPARLERISDPKHPLYVPEADEKNYDKRNSYCLGYVNEVMDLVEKHVGHVTRTRYAVLMPGEEIKEHRDINTDKAIRIHVPLMTDQDVVFGVRGKKTLVEQHMPADGGVWFINQGFPHYVKNNSDKPRVHLVMSVVGQGMIEDGECWYDSPELARVS